MAKITIKIDCEKETCGNCRHRSYIAYNGFTHCDTFIKYIDTNGHKSKDDYNQSLFNTPRCSECIAAEVKNGSC